MLVEPLACARPQPWGELEPRKRRCGVWRRIRTRTTPNGVRAGRCASTRSHCKRFESSRTQGRAKVRAPSGVLIVPVLGGRVPTQCGAVGMVRRRLPLLFGRCGVGGAGRGGTGATGRAQWSGERQRAVRPAAGRPARIAAWFSRFAWTSMQRRRCGFSTIASYVVSPSGALQEHRMCPRALPGPRALRHDA